MSQLTNKPSFVEYQTLKFLIIDAPNDRNLQQYLREFQKYNVKDLVRACEGTYSTEAVVASGVRVHDLPFPDGAPPPQAVIDQWLALCDARFKPKADSKENEGGAIAVHCVAGLGRAPVLVALALIEAGLKPFDAVEYIRKQRRGAINARQLDFLKAYQPRKKPCVML